MKNLSVETGTVARVLMMTTTEGSPSSVTSANVFSSLTQLSMPLPPGTYGFALNLYVRQNVTATRSWNGAIGFTGTSSSICYFNKFTTTTAATPYRDIVSYAWDQTVTIGTYASTTATAWMNIEGRFTATTSGTLVPKLAKGIAGIYDILAYPNSHLCVWVTG